MVSPSFPLLWRSWVGGINFWPNLPTSQVLVFYFDNILRRGFLQLETLSIIAYKQPLTKGDVEQIRGVSCDYSLQKLLEKELIEIKGKSEGIGRPLIYGTSQKFMDYFGINSILDLPQPKDFSQPEHHIGEANG